MKAPKSNNTSDKPRVLVPAGTHLAILYSIVDLGTHSNSFRPDDKPKRMVRLTWELPKKRHDFDGVSKPLSISKEFSFSMYEKATLRKTVESITGATLSNKDADNFDFNQLLGAGCLLSVKHVKSQDGTKTYSSFSGCAPVMEGMTVSKPENKLAIYSIEDGENEVFQALPDWLKKKIQEAPEWKSAKIATEDEDRKSTRLNSSHRT